MSTRHDGSDDPALAITWRAVLVGALTIAAVLCYLILMVGVGSGSGGYVRAQLPIVAFAPFVLWLFVNVGLKSLSPRLALRQGELLTVFSMLWIAGVLPQWGWSDYWLAITTAPVMLSTPENQWSELFFAYLPWHSLPAATPRVVEAMWMGLAQGEPLPWDAWLPVTAEWLAASLAMVVVGYCLVILFHRQWVEAERLGFPLAQLPLELTRGFDGPRRTPDLFRSGAFWAGFGVVFLPMLYNVGAYFSPGLPLLELYTKHYFLELPAGWPALTIRVLPLVLALTYLCPLDILGSLVAFSLLASLKTGAMDRVGFVVGSGQPLSAYEVLSLESFGAIVFIAGWSVWLARRHLREVAAMVRHGRGPRGEVRRYRCAVAGLLLSSAWVVGWVCHLGANLGVALVAFAMVVLTFFVTIKLIAATGFAYLMPSWPNAKGDIFVTQLVGTELLSARDVTAYTLFMGSGFFGNIRVPAWPALPHLLKLFSLARQPGKVTAAVGIAFVVGFLTAVGASLVMAYDKGAATYMMDALSTYDLLSHRLQNPSQAELGKWAVFLLGGGEAMALAVLRANFHWFPLHPVGLAFQQTSGTSIYWFSLFLVWLVKILLLRYGGVGAYRQAKPLFFGLGVGYVIGVVLSGVVDVIWFPLAGHMVHNW